MRRVYDRRAMTVTKKRLAVFSSALGRRIAAIRVEKGLTQEKLAERLNSAKPVISRIERGTSLPSLGRLVEIADALEVDVSELFVGAVTRSDDPHAVTLAAIGALLRHRPVKDGEMLLRVA